MTRSSNEMEHNGGSNGCAVAVGWRWEELTRVDPLSEDGDGESSDGDDGECSKEEVEALREEAYRKGIAEGRRQGRERAEEELRDSVEAALDAHRRLEEVQAERAETVEDEVLTLALAVARQIVGRELDGNRDAYADLVRSALSRIPVDEPVTVRLHPQDLSLISSLSSGNGESVAIAGGREVRWRADSDLWPGGCVVEARDRIVDGTVERCIERVYGALRDE